MDLPEVSTQIFSYLDHASLKMVSEVSKNWRKMVYGETKVLVSSKLLIHNFKQQRKFLRNYGKNFRTVYLRHEGNTSCTRAELIRILESIANVENLKVYGNSLRFLKQESNKISLDNLKTLTLHDSANTFRMSQFLENVELLELTLNIEKTGRYLDENFMDWFLQQRRMKSLTVQERALKIFFNPFPDDKMNVQLRKLSIHPNNFMLPRMNEATFKGNLIKFFESQINLEEVYFENSECILPSPWRNIYAHLLASKTLKKLQIVSEDLPEISVAENRSLESLIVHRPLNGLWIFLPLINPWQTISKFRNLKHIEITGVYDLQNFLLHGSGLDQLETLKLSGRMGDFANDINTFDSINFPNLKDINLTGVFVNHLGWTSITAKCPLIEKITLNQFFLEHASVKLICEKLGNLKEMDLGCGIYTADIFKKIMKNSSLRNLKITAVMLQQMENWRNFGALPKPFKITVKSSIIHEPHEHCPYVKFARAIRSFLATQIFMNNIRDFTTQ
jgi:hypothetical protein